jgi:hypothetical protein
MPINYNPGMDILLFTNKLGFDKKLFFGRYKKNEWRRLSRKEAKNSAYIKRFHVGANAIVVGIIKK